MMLGDTMTQAPGQPGPNVAAGTEGETRERSPARGEPSAAVAPNKRCRPSGNGGGLCEIAPRKPGETPSAGGEAREAARESSDRQSELNRGESTPGVGTGLIPTDP